jgi:hypothetical protein
VDLVIKEGRKLIPVEIKSASTFTPDFLNGHEQYTLKETRIFNPIVHGGLEARQT